MMRAMRVDADRSCLRFIYPFAFSPEGFRARVGTVGRSEWEGDRRPLRVWEQEELAAEGLLAHVAEFVSPHEDGPCAARFWRLTGDALHSASGLGGGKRHSGVAWHLLTPRGEMPFWLVGA